MCSEVMLNITKNKETRAIRGKLWGNAVSLHASMHFNFMFYICTYMHEGASIHLCGVSPCLLRLQIWKQLCSARKSQRPPTSDNRQRIPKRFLRDQGLKDDHQRFFMTAWSVQTYKCAPRTALDSCDYLDPWFDRRNLAWTILILCKQSGTARILM